MRANIFDADGTIAPTVQRYVKTRFSRLFYAGAVFWVMVCGAVLILIIALGTWGTIAKFRERDIQRSERELESRVQLLAGRFDHQFEELEFVLKLIATEIEQRVQTAEQFRAFVATEEYHRYLQTKVTNPIESIAVHIFDVDGNFINSAEQWPVSSVNLADKIYFRVLKNAPNNNPVVIDLVDGRVSPGHKLVIARRIAGPHGELIGVITRSIPTNTFEQLFSSVVLPQGSITLLHQDGTLLARFPNAESAIGQSFSGSPLVTPNRPAGVFETSHFVSPVDGIERVGSAKNLDHYPLAILATTTISSALKDWREETQLLIWVACLAGFVVSAMAGIITLHLRNEKQKLDIAINNMTQGLLLFDSRARVAFYNRQYLKMYNLSSEFVKPGLPFQELVAYRKKSGSFKGDVDEFCSAVLRNVAEKKTTNSVLETVDGRSIQISNTPLANGGWLATLEDITDRRQAEIKIAHLAHFDALTDLPNRVSFRETLEMELQRVKRGDQLAVLYIDIDEFKSVNDSLGHLVGDEFLKNVALRLQQCVRQTDLVARLGGDEFAVIQTNIVKSDDVLELVRRVYEAIRQPYECFGHRIISDASIGIAMAPGDGSDVIELLKNADLAMYGAKADGRRTYRFFEPEMNVRTKERRSLELELREAIEDVSFELHYQPIINLKSKLIVGFEALVRWNHPTRGMISPDQFIPIAEETGLICQIGDWVLASACAEAMKWPSDLKVAVNVSPAQFANQAFPLRVANALAKTGLSGSRLELEITEAVLIRNDEAALSLLKQLQAMGARIALDDFGTGYSSLSYLERFPFDKIKIDRCFVNRLSDCESSSSIVQAVINIAKSREIITTAEGVETELQSQVLAKLGCTEMQGYLFSRPLPASRAIELLSRHNNLATAGLANGTCPNVTPDAA